MAQLGRSQPLKPVLLRGSSTTGLLFETLTDDFATGLVDPAKWPDSFNNYSVVGQRARVEVSSAGWSGFVSGTRYSIIGSYALFRVTAWPAASTATTAYAELILNTDQVATGTQLSFKADVVTGQLTAANHVGFIDGGAVSTAFSTAGDLWLRIDGRVAGQLNFDYSTSGTITGWTTLRSVLLTDAPWTTTANLRALVQGHRDAGTTDFFEWDDFNVPATDPTPSPKVYSPWSAKRLFPLPPGGRMRRGPDLRTPPSSIAAVGLDGALQVPLSFRLTNSANDVLMVAEVKDLATRSVANGGFASATVTLDRPLNVAAPDIKQFGRAYVYDTSSGETVWEGELQDPGKSSDGDGLSWNIVAIGPSGHAKDETFAYVPIGTNLDDWEKFGGSTNSSSVSSFTDASDADGIKVQFSGGINVATPVYVAGRLLTFLAAGTSMAAISGTGIGGGTGQWTENVYAYGPSGPELIDSIPLQTAANNFRGEVGSEFSAGQTTPHIRMDRTGAATAPDDNAFTFFKNLIVQSVRVSEENVAVTSYPNNYCTTTEIVQDLVGAHTTLYDGLDAFIEDVADQITNFWYPDGTTVFDALNDLITLNGAFYWAAWETIPRSGKWRFEFRAWPTTVRYEAGIEDGFEQPQSANDLFNEVAVHWVDSKGRQQTTIRTSTVASLTAAGKTRSERIDLGSEIGSLAAAQSAGDNFLAEHNLPVQNGRLTVARAILDYDRGMMVNPWMIRPGGLVRVRDVDPQPNALNPGGRDGSTVFRVVSVEYRASSNTAQLGLDTDPVSVSRDLAKLKQTSATSKRRHNR